MPVQQNIVSMKSSKQNWYLWQALICCGNGPSFNPKFQITFNLIVNRSEIRYVWSSSEPFHKDLNWHPITQLTWEVQVLARQYLIFCFTAALQRSVPVWFAKIHLLFPELMLAGFLNHVGWEPIMPLMSIFYVACDRFRRFAAYAASAWSKSVVNCSSRIPDRSGGDSAGESSKKKPGLNRLIGAGHHFSFETRFDKISTNKASKNRKVAAQTWIHSDSTVFLEHDTACERSQKYSSTAKVSVSAEPWTEPEYQNGFK